MRTSTEECVTVSAALLRDRVWPYSEAIIICMLKLFDDTVGKTLAAASTLEKDVKAELEKTNNVDAAAYLGTVIAKRALEKGITEVVFDRGGYIYQGKVAALAEAAREAGLTF